MRGLDTNILVRYLTQDDPVQSPRANRWIEEATARGDRCFLNQIMLCEMIWVLRGAYGYGKEELVMVLEKLLLAAQFAIESRDLVIEAMGDYRKGSGDFSDYLIGRRNRSQGCSTTGTFDKSLKKSSLHSIL